LLIAAQEVRKIGLGWRTFRRQVGNYGQGFRCMLRSEYQHWLVRVVLNARMKKAGFEKIVQSSHLDPKTKEMIEVKLLSKEQETMKKQVMRDMNKVLKYIWKLTV
jgi:hypothetical protein